MIDCGRCYRAFRENGVSFFTGVPDSLLKEFCAFITDHCSPSEHLIASNEGAAIALAAGHYLGSGRPALVYMQNSGLGNAINPLLSLADPEVYGVPMVLMVGWRGEPGVKDEPQHRKPGRTMAGLLDTLELPYTVVREDTANIETVIGEACDHAVIEETPVVLLVTGGSFGTYQARERPQPGCPLSREEAIALLTDSLADSDLVVCTTGKASRELFEYRESRGDGHAKDFLTVGSMGHASQIALALALAQPSRDIYCFDGDGAAIMHMGSMAVIGCHAPGNFRHILLNNGAHDSVGGQPTVGHSINFTRLASAMGYRVGRLAKTRGELIHSLDELRHHEGPWLLEVRVRRGARADLGRPSTTPKMNRDALMTFLGVLRRGDNRT